MNHSAPFSDLGTCRLTFLHVTSPCGPADHDEQRKATHLEVIRDTSERAARCYVCAPLRHLSTIDFQHHACATTLPPAVAYASSIRWCISLVRREQVMKTKTVKFRGSSKQSLRFRSNNAEEMQRSDSELSSSR